MEEGGACRGEKGREGGRGRSKGWKREGHAEESERNKGGRERGELKGRESYNSLVLDLEAEPLTHGGELEVEGNVPFGNTLPTYIALHTGSVHHVCVCVCVHMHERLHTCVASGNSP